MGLGFSVPGIVYETTDFSYAVKIRSIWERDVSSFDYRICRRMVLVSRRDKTVHASDLSKPWNIGIALGRIHASGQENGRKDQ